jgi:5-methylcytosine-specific restriction endonuclease McrA
MRYTLKLDVDQIKNRKLSIIETGKGEMIAVLVLWEDRWAIDYSTRSPYDAARIWKKRSGRDAVGPLSLAILAIRPQAQKRVENLLAETNRRAARRAELEAARHKKHQANAAKAFYASWEWKKARFEAINRLGRKCLCCGFVPVPGSTNYLVVDHIKPRKRYPKLALDPNNLQVLCNDCNMGKSNRSIADFRPLRD